MVAGLAARALRRGRSGWRGLWGLALPLLALPAAGQAGEPVDSEAAGDDTTYVETPLFPGVELSDALRLQLRSRFVPHADLDPGHVDRHSPELRARVTIPISQRAVVRLNGLLGESVYDFSGGTPFRSLADPLRLHEARLSFDAAYQLNEPGRHWLIEDEDWSLLGLVSASSDWEGGDFEEGLGGSLGLGFGYRLPDRFRLALGAILRTDLDEGGIEVAPYGSFRWSISERLTLRDRGLGLLLQYRLLRSVEVFVSGFRSSDRWRLKDRMGMDDLSFRDRQVQVGAGVEWRITRYLRLNVEAGGIVSRKLRLHSDDFGTLFSQSADSTPYVDLRFEIRPGKI